MPSYSPWNVNRRCCDWQVSCQLPPDYSLIWRLEVTRLDICSFDSKSALYLELVWKFKTDLKDSAPNRDSDSESPNQIKSNQIKIKSTIPRHNGMSRGFVCAGFALFKNAQRMPMISERSELFFRNAIPCGQGNSKLSSSIVLCIRIHASDVR